MSKDRANTVTYQGKIWPGDLRFTPSGTAVCNSRMCMSRRVHADSNEWHTAWFTVTAFNDVAETIASLSKKDEVTVVGRLAVEAPYKERDAELSIVAERVELISSGESPPRTSPEPSQVGTDDVPF